MNKNTFYIIVIVGLLISNGILAFFFTQKGDRRRPKRSPKEIISKRLDFDATQVAKYEIIIKGHQEASRQIMGEIHKSKRVLYDYLNVTDGFGKRDSLIQQVTLKQGALEELNFNHFLDIKRICNENQTQKFEELSHDFFKMFRKKRPPKR